MIRIDRNAGSALIRRVAVFTSAARVFPVFGAAQMLIVTISLVSNTEPGQEPLSPAERFTSVMSGGAPCSKV